jgi:hypothetical protein
MIPDFGRDRKKQCGTGILGLGVGLRDHVGFVDLFLCADCTLYLDEHVVRSDMYRCRHSQSDI